MSQREDPAAVDDEPTDFPAPAEMPKPELRRALLAALKPERDFWVFAYGSLMWNPGFAFRDRSEATLYGYHRRMCMYSHHYRGTPDHPGLVLGLDRGGSCRGIAYRIAGADGDAVVDYLWRREMVSGAYDPRFVRVLTNGGRRHAHTFVVDRNHEQYAGGLTAAETVALIRQGLGARGSCTDYLAATVAHLDELGIPDRALHKLLKLARR